MARDERDREREQPESEHVREHDPIGVAHRNRQQEEPLAGDEEAERREQRATRTHDRRSPAHAFMPAIVDEHAEREQERDARDINRGTAPLQRVEGAYLLDTSDLSVDQAVTQVLNWYAKLHH